MKKMILAMVVAGARMATASLPACHYYSGDCSIYNNDESSCTTTYEVDSGTPKNCVYDSGTGVCSIGSQCDDQSTTQGQASTTAPGNPATDVCNAGQSSTGDSYNVLVKETAGDMRYSRCCTDNTASDCYGSELSYLVGKDIDTLTNEQADSLCRASSLCGPYICCNYNEELGHVLCNALSQEDCPTRYCKPTSNNLDPGFFGRLQEDGCLTCLPSEPGVEAIRLEDDAVCSDLQKDLTACNAAYQKADYTAPWGSEFPGIGGFFSAIDGANQKCTVKNGGCEAKTEFCTSAATATQSSVLLVAISVAVIAYELIKE